MRAVEPPPNARSAAAPRGRPARRLGAALLLLWAPALACYDDAGGGDEASDASSTGAPATGGEETGASTGAPAGPDECEGVVEQTVAPLRLLTRFEYDNTVRDLLFDAGRPARAFAQENKVGGFENNSAAHVANPLLVRQFMEVSESVAAKAVAQKLGKLLPCDPAVAGDAACGAAFVDAFLPRAFRRPVDADELAAFQGLFAASLPTEGFAGAVALVIQATLQSPQFLYRLELPGAGEPAGAAVPVTGYEMASRLSYFLHASMPDDALLAAAAAGELSTPAQVEAQARRLLADPKARDTMRSFHRQWLGLDALSSVVKDAIAYPGFDPAYNRDWEDSVLSFVEYVWGQSGTIEEMFSSPAVFLTDSLAQWYGYLPPGEASEAIHKYEFPGERAGLLTQPGLMTMLGHPDQSSPIARGVFVRQQILCQILPPPPPDVMVTPPSPDPEATTRERFRQHTEDPACQGCHSLIDPLGFGFENYDGVGRWRTSENGLPVDASGEVVGAIDQDLVGPFTDAADFAHKLVDSDDLRRCVVRKWFTYALGRDASPVADTCSLTRADDLMAASGGDLRELVVAVTQSDAFRYRSAKIGGGL